MQTHDTRTPQDATRPARKQLTLHKETLRRLTPAALRLAAGGRAAGSATQVSSADYLVWQRGANSSG